MRLFSTRFLPVSLLAAAGLAFAPPCHADLKAGMTAYYNKDYAAAETELRPLAELGDPDASFYLGEVYRVGFRGNDDYTAYKMLSRAARAQFHAAATGLLEMRRQGRISFAPGAYMMKPAEVKALLPLKTVADDPGDARIVDPDTRARLAAAYCDDWDGSGSAKSKDKDKSGRHPEVMDYLRAAAQAGQPQAQFNLGMAYMASGYCAAGVTPDIKTALGWLRKAADGGIVQAQVVIAQAAYYRTLGADVDSSEGIERLQRAVLAGSPGAYVLMGQYYENGFGVAADASEAARWYGRAAELDEPEAFSRLANLYLKGLGVEQDDARAVDLLKHGALLGDSASAGILAYAYLNGDGVERDVRAFGRMLELSAQGDNALAQYSLALELFSGKLLKRDEDKGADFMRTAAHAGYGPALLALGSLYESGRAVGQDLGRAYGLYLLAEQRQTPDAKKRAAGIKSKLSAKEIALGEKLAQTWQPVKTLPGSFNWRAQPNARPEGLDF
jgi:TPR repeat protein